MTVTGAPVASATLAGSGSWHTVAGTGTGIRPGQGRSGGRSGSRVSPNGTSVACSSAPRPPESTGRVTAPWPSMADPAGRHGRPGTMIASPHRPSWRPWARTRRSGVSLSRTIPLGWTPSSPACPPGAAWARLWLPACELPADALGHRQGGQQPVVPPQPRVFPCLFGRGASHLHPHAGQPVGGSPSCIRSARALAANTTGSASGAGGSNSALTDRSAAGGRAARAGVQAAGQPVRDAARHPEPVHRLAGGQPGEVPQRRDAQPGQQFRHALAVQPGQQFRHLPAVQHADRVRGKELPRLARGDHRDRARRRRAGGELRGEQPIGNAWPGRRSRRR